MTGQEILTGMNYISDELVHDAETFSAPALPLRRWLPVAACLALFVVCGSLFFSLFGRGMSTTAPEAEQMLDAANSSQGIWAGPGNDKATAAGGSEIHWNSAAAHPQRPTSPDRNSSDGSPALHRFTEPLAQPLPTAEPFEFRDMTYIPAGTEYSDFCGREVLFLLTEDGLYAARWVRAAEEGYTQFTLICEGMTETEFLTKVEQQILNEEEEQP